MLIPSRASTIAIRSWNVFCALPDCRPIKMLDDFVFIVLREQTPDKRKQIIGYMLENMPDVGLLIIDGIRDLMYDINSPSESTDLSQPFDALVKWV